MQQREEFRIKYLQLDADNLQTLGNASFDIVLANMTLMDMKNAEGAIRESSRVLRRNGRLVASISHPCFDNGEFSSWLMEKTGYLETVSRKIRNYREPSDTLIDWRVSPDQLRQTRSYHRPLSWYAKILSSFGFLISALEEPEPNQEFIEKDPQGHWIRDIPLHLVIEAVKA